MWIVRANWITMAMGVVVALTVITTAIYTLSNFTAVPYWDMFDGTLNFYERISQGNWLALWEPHNEHRIVLAKLLFLVDFSLWGGTTPFLHIMNLLLAGLIAFVLILYARDILNGPWFSLINLLIIGFSFHLLAHQNFSDAFQSQFFLASLLPLTALFFAHRSASEALGTGKKFALSAGLGTVSALSMANGVFALPVLAVYALITRMSWYRVAVLVFLAGVVVAAYLYGYSGPEHHGSPFNSLKRPLEIVHFLLLYLGLGSAPLGLLMVVAMIAACWKFLRNRDLASAEIALLAFVGYTFLTAAITAFGRIEFGLGAASSSRYATPVFAAFSALAILYVPVARNPNPRFAILRHQNWRIAALLFMVVLLQQQNRQFMHRNDRDFPHLMGALALELGLTDQTTVVAIYPHAAAALRTSVQARAIPLMIWALPPIRNADGLIGTRLPLATPEVCFYAIDRTEVLQGGSQMQRTDGWLGIPTQEVELIYLTDAAGKIDGIGLIGGIRKDVRRLHPDFGKLTGFSFYAPEGLILNELFLGTKEKRCILGEK
jgi:hypothetical protein